MNATINWSDVDFHIEQMKKESISFYSIAYMIPKIIHCVWLSGEDKPEVYKKCIDSWIDKMPDYEIKEWSLKNLPKEVLNHSFVASAIQAKKMAYATDFIRLWALYNYGGIYLDMDVMVL